MSKYWHNKTPKCPWCDHEIEDLFECGASDRDGETRELECEMCEKKYEAETHVAWSFSTKAVGCLFHKFKCIDEINKNFECVECHNQYYDWQFPNGRYPKFKTEFEIIKDSQ